MRIKNSISEDPVSPTDFNHLKFIYCCEQCSFFVSDEKRCSIGYNAYNHTYETQQKRYELNGRIAFCRSQEID